jgi:hypothetical protein
MNDESTRTVGAVEADGKKRGVLAMNEYTAGNITDDGFYREPCLPMNQTMTVGGTYFPNSNWPYTSWPYITYPSVYVSAPVECSGDVHVFPCPHCDKCKCGAATVKRKKKA